MRVAAEPGPSSPIELREDFLLFTETSPRKRITRCLLAPGAANVQSLGV